MSFLLDATFDFTYNGKLFRILVDVFVEQLSTASVKLVLDDVRVDQRS